MCMKQADNTGFIWIQDISILISNYQVELKYSVKIQKA